MKRLFFTIALIVLPFSAYANLFKIGDIRIEGLQRVSASPVFAAMPVQVGDSVDSEDMRQVMQAIFNTGFFTDVQLARDGDVLILILKERPAIKEIGIDGNKAIKTEQLEEIMTDNGLSEGEILQEYLLEGITRELERQYVSQARYGAKVETSVETLANNMVKIDIDVDEGSAAKIRHFNIVGNSAFSDKELLENFELGEARWYRPFSSKSRYAKERLNGDVEILESFYLDRGYLDFRITSSQVSVSPDKKSVYITLNIDEGDVYTINQIDIAGDPILPERTIRRIIRMKKGDTFSQARMTSTSEYIENLLGNAGYTNAQVDGVPKKSDKENDKESNKENLVDLNFFIDPGKRVYVRRIEFNGNTKTSDNVLRREMRQIEGASASNARIEQSKVRLERLGYFREVSVDTKEVPGSDDLVDVEYSVEEQPSGSISASIGYAQFSGLNLGFSVQNNNWLGSGKSVGLSLNRNIFQEIYNLSINDPYFTPDGVSRGMNIFLQSRDFSEVSIQQFSTNSFGAGVTFGYPISETSRLSFGLGVVNQQIATGALAPQEIRLSPFIREDQSITNYVLGSDILDGNSEVDLFAINQDLLEDFDSTEEGFIEKFGNEFNSVTFSAGWSRFALNRGVLATRGTSQQFSIEGTVPGSELEYVKFTYDAEAFLPINRLFTLRFKTTLGYGEGYGDLDELPFFENFYAGGFGSVRGYERSTLGPKASTAFAYVDTLAPVGDLNNDGDLFDVGETAPAFILCDEAYAADQLLRGGITPCEVGTLVSEAVGFVDSTNNSFGGNILMEFSTELILPIPFISDTRSMQLAAFVDAGNVFSTSCRETQVNCSNVDFDKLSSSVGLGFTWISGFGPMTFAISRPINQNDFDEREAFQFTFGTGF